MSREPDGLARSGEPSAPHAVPIAALAYRRVGRLAALLPLSEHEGAAVRPHRRPARVLIVDNDPHASTRFAFIDDDERPGQG